MGESEKTISKKEWFAMRATYRRELQAQRLLDESGIRSYIPMQIKERTVRGRRQRIQVPAVHNLVFVYSSREVLQQTKSRIPYLQYIMDRSGSGQAVPIVVPDKAMEDFIRVVQASAGAVEYMPVGDRKFREGMKVRVHGGILDGVEGVLVKSGKSKDRKLTVSLNGVLSVTTVLVEPDSIEVLGGR